MKVLTLLLVLNCIGFVNALIILIDHTMNINYDSVVFIILATMLVGVLLSHQLAIDGRTKEP